MITNIKLINTNTIPSLGIEFHRYVHESGATIVHAVPPPELPDSTFAIAFRTPASDSSGVQHICEHSVLCGSARFPVKEPFSNLLQASLQTYLNAFTYTDHTVYPVQSRCQRDLVNLASVYIDAVFNPLMLEDERIFMQEGHRVQLDSTDSEPRYQGIVLNEMKGALSDPLQHGGSMLQCGLLHGTRLGFDAGGVPEEILKLSYHSFCEYHRQHYRPENAVVFLLTRFPVLPEIIAQLDASLEIWHARCGSEKIAPHISFAQIEEADVKPVAMQECVYAGAADEAKTHSFLGVLGGPIKRLSAIDQHMLQLLDYVMHDAPGAPVAAAAEKRLCASFQNQLNMSEGFVFCMQELLDVKAPDTIIAAMHQIYEDAAQQLTVESILGALNNYEIKLREITDEYGVETACEFFERELSGADFISFADFEPILEQIRAMPPAALLSKARAMIVQYFATPVSALVLRPDPNAAKLMTEAEKKELQAIVGALGPQELKQLVAVGASVKERQEMHDPSEKLALLPILERADLAGVCNDYEHLRFTELNGVQFMETGNELHYFRLLFDIAPHSAHEVSAFSLLGELLTELPTVKRGVPELSRAISAATGDITFSVNQEGDSMYFCAEFSCLHTTVKAALDVVAEVVRETTFRKDLRLLLRVARRVRSRVLEDLNGEGVAQAVAAASIGSCLPSAVVSDLADGFGFATYLRHAIPGASANVCGEEEEEEQEKEAEEIEEEETADVMDGVAELAAEMEALLAALSKCSVRAFVGTAHHFWAGIVEDVRARFPLEEKTPTAAVPFKLLPAPKHFHTHQLVNYIYASKRVPEISPATMLASHLLDVKYMWDRVRVLGGAYNGGAAVYLERVTQLSSYRDPHVDETVKTIFAAASWLSELQLTDHDLLQLAIGAIGTRQPPVSPAQRLARGMSFFILGIDPMAHAARVERIATITLEELHAVAPAFSFGPEHVVAALGHHK